MHLWCVEYQMCRGYVSTSCKTRHNKVYFNVTQKAKKKVETNLKVKEDQEHLNV